MDLFQIITLEPTGNAARTLTAAALRAPREELCRRWRRQTPSGYSHTSTAHRAFPPFQVNGPYKLEYRSAPEPVLKNIRQVVRMLTIAHRIGTQVRWIADKDIHISSTN